MVTTEDLGAGQTESVGVLEAPEVSNDIKAGDGIAAQEQPLEPYTPVPVEIKSLLEAGAHYGHKVEKWNPKMLPYIYTQRNKIHIINLDLTMELWRKARKFVLDVVSRGGSVLIVGTKDQARDAVEQAARRCGAHYINRRWLGGTLSNFQTIKNSINRMGKLEELLREAEDPESKVKIAKKERLNIARQLKKLGINLGGIRELKKAPDLLFVIDVKKEAIAVAEAHRLHIPVVALVDTNVDPTVATMPIPSNDDASGTIRLFVNALADAVIEGSEQYQMRLRDREASAAKRREQDVAAAAQRAADRKGRRVSVEKPGEIDRAASKPESSARSGS